MFKWLTIHINIYRARTIELNRENQWKIQEFQNQGCGPIVVDFFKSEDCFVAPLKITYVFEVRVENRILFVNIAYVYIYACYAVKKVE